MKTSTMVIGGIVLVIVIIAGVIIIIKHFSAPKDTPIVMGGGSVYGNTSTLDTVGWTMANNLSYYGSLHASTKNPLGIDNLIFKLFDSNPNPNPVTGTGGWAVVVRNPLPPPSSEPNLTPAVQFCSDSTCSAFNPPCVSFNPNGNVYFNVRSGAQLVALPGSGPGGVILKINFHDTTTACNSPTPNACDKIYDVNLYTCRGGSNPVFTTTCNTNPTSCAVQVGN